jgi:hypothetical protein
MTDATAITNVGMTIAIAIITAIVIPWDALFFEGED